MPEHLSMSDRIDRIGSLLAKAVHLAVKKEREDKLKQENKKVADEEACV